MLNETFSVIFKHRVQIVITMKVVKIGQVCMYFV